MRLRNRHMHTWLVLTGIGFCPWLLGGCASGSLATQSVNRVAVKQRALEVIQAAVNYPENPVVRLEAIEAISTSGCDECLTWVRIALHDAQPAVRFAACTALGDMMDAKSIERLRHALNDTDANVRAAAIYALHRLGDTSHTSELSTLLLRNENVTVRRNVALLLGKLGDTSAIKVLASAMGDKDEGVRQHALEAMARLGNDEACKELSFMTNSGIGSVEVFAIRALGETGRREYADPFRYKLTTSEHLEVRLAAARSLAELGQPEGLDFARRALRSHQPTHKDPKDSEAGQILRGRLMAAAALGAIASPDALSDLETLMEDSSDPRLQVSGAKAILQILAAEQRRALPFSPNPATEGR